MPRWHLRNESVLHVKVLPEVGHDDRSEAQLWKGDRPWGGSVELGCGPMDKNRTQGDAERGDRAKDREARR